MVEKSNSDCIEDKSTDIRSLEYISKIQELNEMVEILSKKGEGTFASVFIVKGKQPNSQEKFALKMLIPTVDVKRIENEIRILRRIGGQCNVVEMFSCLRLKDHIFILMPYVSHVSFSEYFWKMDLKEIRDYFKNLLIALRHVHKFGIIHRDIKPNNFLYDRKRRKYALVDFGLAHSEYNGDLGPWWDKLLDSGTARKSSALTMQDHKSIKRVALPSSIKESSAKRSRLSTYGGGVTSPSVLCRCGNNRLTVCNGCKHRSKQNARRGGTLGYRAPEVMMRETDQTCAVDIWSVGVMLATFLTLRHPFAKGEDDFDVLHMMTHFCGYERMQEAASCLNKKILITPLPEACHLHYHLWMKQRCEYLRKNEKRFVNNASLSIGHEHKFSDAIYRLLAGLLQPVPGKRLTADQALKEPYFRDA